MRDAWISTFKEMRVHMNNQEEVRTVTTAERQLGIKLGAFKRFANVPAVSTDDDEDEQDDKPTGKLYVGKCVNGMIRNNASRNSAANLAFQGLVAYGAKLAGWNLLHAGYGDRLLAFIHDEYLYWLYPEELEANIPIIEQLMLQGMGIAIPDVTVGCETSCCRHWDKKACEFVKLPRDEKGNVIVEENAKVKEIYESKTTGCSD